MIAKLLFFFFCRKTEAMVLIWTPHPPHPQTHISLLKSSSLSWMGRGTNWEGRLIQQRCQWELWRDFGWGGGKPRLRLCPPCPSSTSRAGGSRWEPPRDGPACAKGTGQSPGEAVLGQGERLEGLRCHPKREGSVFISSCSSGTAGFALPEETFLIFPPSPSPLPALGQAGP